MKRFIVAVFAIFSVNTLQAQSDVTPGFSTVNATGLFNKAKINYTAVVQETLLAKDKKNVGSIISTSYIATGGKKDRPVIFVFNGGPGSSSSLLHMGALGPKRLIFDEKHEQSVIIDNPHSVLDVCDLVFIDPPGTGFTKILDSTGIEKYWDVYEDAKAFTSLITDWRKKYQRETSPLYICGESYGGARVATMLHVAPELKFSGAVLLSPMLDAGATEAVEGNDMPYILFLPSLSTVAWYHHKIKTNLSSAEEVFNQAASFSLTEYAPALMKGNRLTDTEKKATAEKLASLTGLTAEFLLAHNLRVNENDFVLALLAGDEKRIGRLDARVTGSLNAPKVRPPWDDPSMKSGPPARPSIDRYYKETLKFPGTGDYTTLNLFANSKWQWYEYKGLTAYWTVAPYLTEAAIANPKLKFMLCGGYYDLATPIFAAQYAMEHSGVAPERVHYYKFASGHSIFVNDEGLIGLTTGLRKLVSEE